MILKQALTAYLERSILYSLISKDTRCLHLHGSFGAWEIEAICAGDVVGNKQQGCEDVILARSTIANARRNGGNEPLFNLEQIGKSPPVLLDPLKELRNICDNLRLTGLAYAPTIPNIRWLQLSWTSTVVLYEVWLTHGETCRWNSMKSPLWFWLTLYRISSCQNRRVQRGRLHTPFVGEVEFLQSPQFKVSRESPFANDQGNTSVTTGMATRRILR
jgi:hypothetical protein